MNTPQSKKSKKDIIEYVLEQAQKEVQELRNSFEQEKKKLLARHKQDVERKLRELDKLYAQKEDLLTKQKESSFTLHAKKAELAAQERVVDQVLECVREELNKPEVVEKFARQLLQEEPEIKELRIPRKIKLKAALPCKVSSTLDTWEIVGILNEQSEVSISFEDLLTQNEAKIFKTVEEELFS
ncbi:hypothetical protein D6774_04340 [Candidatus Woesearchaeota archaeon]|nr:MAG: hypothetical protein D6774_04340 [Candidatus Woesearchaeota archaeon]